VTSESAAPQDEAPVAPSRPEDRRSRPSTPPFEALERVGRWTAALLSRPRAKTLIIGAALILVGAIIVTHSAWTLPLVLVGIIMVIVAWMGSRFEGRLVVEWSEAGAGFELRARVKPASVTGAPLALSAPHRGGAGAATSIATDAAAASALDAAKATVEAVEAVETIEGTAHTEEIDAIELRRLVDVAGAGSHDSSTHAQATVSWREDAA
jgi:hypothetical protein